MPVLVKIMTIKWLYKSHCSKYYGPVAYFLSSINNTFFSMLVIICNINMSYFCFNYTNTFFIRTTNYFSVVLSNYFSNVYGELFFHWAENYFSQCRKFISGLQCFVGLALEVHWFESLTSLGDHFENFEVEECFQRECQGEHCQGKKRKRFSSFFQNLSGTSSLRVNDEVFWTEDLIEETTKRLHDSYTILTLIEHDMSAQLNSSLPNLIPRVFVPYYTCWLSERSCGELECPLHPTLNVRKDLPILILMGGHKSKNQSNFPVSEFYSN